MTKSEKIFFQLVERLCDVIAEYTQYIDKNYFMQSHHIGLIANMMAL